MSKSRTKARIEEKRSKTRKRNIIIGVSTGLAAAAAIILLVTNTGGDGGSEERAGVNVPLMANPQLHVDEGSVTEYDSNPPTSGPHYAQSATGGFYPEGIADGYLVHSLEHGYVIFWYDCSNIPTDTCESLKTDIQSRVGRGPKLIGVPREGMNAPLVLSSWGRMMELEYFDEDAIDHYVRTNFNQAPEPNAN